MIEENEKYYNRFLAVVDAVILTISYWLAWYVRFRSGIFSSSVEAVPYAVYMRALFVMIPAMLILYSACNLYSTHRLKGRRVEIASITQANVTGGLIFRNTGPGR